MKTKEFTISIIFIVVSLLIHRLFPADGIFQQIIATLVFFVALPLLFNKFILKKEVREFGFGLFDYRQGLLWSIFSLLIVGAVFFIISSYSEFLNNYTVPVYITEKFSNFIIYELFLIIPFVFVYEFYFRGFVLAILRDKIGYWSILVQSLVFLILVLIGGNAVGFTQFIPYLVFAPFAGIIAYKSRSIIYSAASQFLVLFFLSLVIIKRIG
ncbi:MAG: hypothetical protein ACD_24C00160G0004 [uncultured bacterium]|nr:MAG: hypothetical protein ACD_24C00160G0004 [uncultured bacterium]